jgi:hypothetical protein
MAEENKRLGREMGWGLKLGDLGISAFFSGIEAQAQLEERTRRA